MADIHVGTVSAGHDVTVYYHVPVAEALRAGVLAAFGAQTLAAPGSTEAEHTAAAQGAVREVVEKYNVDITDPEAVYIAALRVQARWSEIAAAEAERLATALIWYGVTLARA